MTGPDAEQDAATSPSAPDGRAAQEERTAPPAAAAGAGSATPAVIDERPQGDSPTPLADGEWRRLSWRMLLVTPLGILTRLLPLFALSLWLGTNRSNYWFEIGITSLVVFFSLLRWLTTSYRIGDRKIVMRRGFFTRNEVTISRDRIRSVDTESDLFHRLLRVSIVEVGTGQQEQAKSEAGRFRLDSIDSREVEPLREELLSHLRELDPSLGLADEEQWGSRFGEDISQWKITWARFAPFSLMGFGVLLTIWILTWQMGDMHDRLLGLSWVAGTREWLATFDQPWRLLGEGIGVWLVAGVLAIITYAIRYGKYSLTDAGKVLYVQNGILRRKHIALDKARLRGVEIRLPVYLRILGGGRLEPIMTGTKKGSRASTLLPQAPLKDVRRVAERIVSDPDLVTAPLVKHGRRAAQRRITRALLPWYALMIALVLVRVDRGPEFDVWLWSLGPAGLVFFLALGVDRIRMLGHLLAGGRLVTAHGSWSAKRVVLDSDGIIAFTTRTTPLQRWAKLTTLTAATPAGLGGYGVVDVPADRAWAIAESLTPGITDVWGTTKEAAGSTGVGRHRREP